jgi:hypothetical protein
VPKNFKIAVAIAFALVTVSAGAAEKRFDFSQYAEDEAPKGFKSVVAGEGKPGEWKVILETVAPKLAPLTDKAQAVAKQAVLAQLSKDRTDEHFPILLYDEEKFEDFTFTTRLKTVLGDAERMAGVVFRAQDEKNFYVARISSQGSSFRYYKVVNGERGLPIEAKLPLPSDEWHELTVECSGDHIRLLLDQKELIPMLTDQTFTRGKVGFWTKSDSVSYFADARIQYKPIEVPAQVVVRDTLKKYPRLLGLKIYVRGKTPDSTLVVGSKDPSECGQAGGKSEMDVIKQGQVLYGKDAGSVTVCMPLRDRNGETMAAVRVVMKSFTGQTEANAVARAAPIVKEMQNQVQSLQDLVEE